MKIPILLKKKVFDIFVSNGNGQKCRIVVSYTDTMIETFLIYFYFRKLNISIDILFVVCQPGVFVNF